MPGRANELLGHPAGARLLLLNADDLGMYPGVSEGIAEVIEAGLVRSTSVIVPSPWAVEAKRWAALHPEASLGVHLTLVRDLGGADWSPLAGPTQVPSLVDRDGRFLPLERMDEMLARARIEEVELEFRAQLQAVLGAGLRPTHLDWHCVISGGRPDVFERTLVIAREHGLAVRVTEQPWIDRLQSLGLPTAEHPLLDSYEVPVDAKPEVYLKMLRELPEGLTQWAMHPGRGDEASRTHDPDGWRIRESDTEFLTSPAAARAIRDEGIVLVSFAELRRAWLAAGETRSPPEGPSRRDPPQGPAPAAPHS